MGLYYRANFYWKRMWDIFKIKWTVFYFVRKVFPRLYMISLFYSLHFITFPYQLLSLVMSGKPCAYFFHFVLLASLCYKFSAFISRNTFHVLSLFPSIYPVFFVLPLPYVFNTCLELVSLTATEARGVVFLCYLKLTVSKRGPIFSSFLESVSSEVRKA